MFSSSFYSFYLQTTDAPLIHLFQFQVQENRFRRDPMMTQNKANHLHLSCLHRSNNLSILFSTFNDYLDSSEMNGVRRLLPLSFLRLVDHISPCFTLLLSLQS